MAKTGSFGYELDPSRLTEQEKEEVHRQIADYKKNWEIYGYGTFYRLLPNPVDQRESAWMQVSADRKRAVVSYVVKAVTANAPVRYLKLRGLKPDALYEVSGLNLVTSGAALMCGGLPVPELYGDYPAVSFEVTELEQK